MKEEQMKAMKVYLTDEQDAIIRKQAKKNGLKLSAYIRKVFTQYTDIGSLKRLFQKLDQRISKMEESNSIKD